MLTPTGSGLSDASTRARRSASTVMPRCTKSVRRCYATLASAAQHGCAGLVDLVGQVYEFDD